MPVKPLIFGKVLDLKSRVTADQFFDAFVYSGTNAKLVASVDAEFGVNVRFVHKFSSDRDVSQSLLDSKDFSLVRHVFIDHTDHVFIFSRDIQSSKGETLIPM